MPVTVVVGGQFGSEGKGKVAHWFARGLRAQVAVRVGGSNSGHTVIDDAGREYKFRHLPTPCILPGVISVIGPGSYIDPDVLRSEISQAGVSQDRLFIDPDAVIISPRHKEQEQKSGLVERIGSTGSGTGAAVADRAQRNSALQFARDLPSGLLQLVRPVRPLLRQWLREGQRVIVEGTQGFGLSVLNSAYFPHVTSRDTTAAAALAEAGLSPLDVDQVILVIRTFPIRVAGPSGPLPDEIDWKTITSEGRHKFDILERTTVTDNVRRVARFHPAVVRAAIDVNAPTTIALNHVDYVDPYCREGLQLTDKADRFVLDIEKQIGREISYVGFGPNSLEPRSRRAQLVRRA
jgi:adenylosuccinate synthase